MGVTPQEAIYEEYKYETEERLFEDVQAHIEALKPNAKDHATRDLCHTLAKAHDRYIVAREVLIDALYEAELAIERHARSSGDGFD